MAESQEQTLARTVRSQHHGTRSRIGAERDTVKEMFPPDLITEIAHHEGQNRRWRHGVPLRIDRKQFHRLHPYTRLAAS